MRQIRYVKPGDILEVTFTGKDRRDYECRIVSREENSPRIKETLVLVERVYPYTVSVSCFDDFYKNMIRTLSLGDLVILGYEPEFHSFGGNMYIQKEVFFDIYCPKCKFYENKEYEEPCCNCLENGSNDHSHKPTEYKKKEDDK